MKKVFLILLLLLLLCGCQKAKPEYLISSIGVDYKNGQITTCFEAVVSNSETDEQTVKLIKGNGKTLKNSIAEITRQCTQEVLLSHCAVVVLGENLPEKQLNEIYGYCLENEDITLSTIFVETQNAEKLLSKKPVSTIAVGYDILSLIEQVSKNEKINFQNRYFEIMAQKEEKNLPKINVTKEGYYLEKR